ncbi:uncharacterized protein LOC133310199 [Gastrolobium bilobum]|uniref:uncharacterized protein LOC133310199 n=1 Tax=Gastrolobium bilobum TaxID=150636 RepID=UPI002AB0C3CF|nr:uncharacterized protein LOC133310199 [Gastrolobium bilobum]
MSELHSLALPSCLYGSSLGWDYHNLGVLNADKMSLIPAMDGSEPSFSHQQSDFSTGYLEDALIEFGERSKRRRLLPYTDEQSLSFIDDFEKSLWNFNPTWHQPEENFYCMNQIERICGFSDEHISTFKSRISEEPNILQSETKTQEETISTSESPNSSSSSYKEPVTSKTRVFPDGSDDEKRKKKVITRVVYPFALVKPGGREGDVTLNDINERILMAPTRPVKHPVGDFACRPCVSAEGPGLSGKAVVALTRIHTQGRGTITIIRTKG